MSLADSHNCPRLCGQKKLSICYAALYRKCLLTPVVPLVKMGCFRLHTKSSKHSSTACELDPSETMASSAAPCPSTGLVLPV